MEQPDTAIVVFTARSPARIVREKGSQAWVLNPVRARQCKWLVCTQNQHHPDHEFSDATEPHGAAFLVGKIAAIVPSAEDADRWLIEISEFARLEHADLWGGHRNPVRYSSLKELGIDIAGLEFKSLAGPANSAQLSPAADKTWPPAALTIAEAKKALAATFGVKPDAVEITIRG